MQVHQVVHYPTLQVILDPIDNDLAADVEDLEIGQVFLVIVFVHGLVNLLIISDAIAEVLCRLLGILALVVGACGLHVADVGHDEILIVALALHKDDLDALPHARLLHPGTAILGGVGGVQDADNTARLEPLKHIGYRCFGSRTAPPFAVGIVRVEKVGSGLSGILTPIIADVKDICPD